MAADPETSLQQGLEKLAEELVFAELGEADASRGLAELMDKLAQGAEEAGLQEIRLLFREGARFLHRLGNGEPQSCAEPAESLTLLVQALQQLVVEKRPLREVLLPGDMDLPLEELGLASSSDEDPELQGWAWCLAQLPRSAGEEMLAEFLQDQIGILEEMEELLLRLEQQPLAEDLGELKRRIHTLKGEAGLLGLAEVGRLCHALESAIESRPFGKIDSLVFECRDWLMKKLLWCEDKGPRPESPDTLIERLLEQEEADSGPVMAAADLEHTGAGDFLRIPDDTDMLADFIQESRDHLEHVELQLLRLESDEYNEEDLNAVFRAFHTIKGLAGFFQLDAIQSMAHESESLLDKVRSGKVAIVASTLDIIFDCADMLKKMVAALAEALESGQPTAAIPPRDELLHRVTTLRSAPAARNTKPDERPLGQILVENRALPVEELEAALEKQRDLRVPKVGEILVEDGMAPRRVVDEALRRQREEAPQKPIGQLLVGNRQLNPEDLDAALKRQQEPRAPRLGEVLVREGKASAGDVRQALKGQGRNGAQARARVSDIVKVESHRLDLLVDTIGELVIAETMVVRNPEILEQGGENGRHRILGQLDKITRELQEMAMSLRMVSLRNTFQKMARLTRDVSRKVGKPVAFRTEGEETELDKNLVDRIGDPLVHMIRNAVDHGIEDDPAERLAVGKPEAGQVTLRASHKGGGIWIEVADDGKGLDPEKIRAKAIERGLLAPEDRPSERELLHMIFEPGFSTAKTVTDVSGRGVGMDVVRRSIEVLRGSIEVQSEPGRGTRFMIRLPLTLAIIEGMVTRIQDVCYIFPTLSIVRLLDPEDAHFETVGRTQLLLRLGQELVPAFDLAEVYGLHRRSDRKPHGVCVIVEDDNGRAAFFVDELVGQQQIVIKSLGQTFQDLKGLSGGAIMPDGRVGLIVDVAGLVRQAMPAGSGRRAVHETAPALPA